MSIQALDERADLGSTNNQAVRSSVSVAILDAETLFREGIKQILGLGGPFDVVVDVVESSGLTDRPGAENIDVVLFGLGLTPEADLHTLQMLLTARPQSRALVLSSHDQAVFVRTAVELGAAGYVLKTVSTTELLRAVLLVADGYPYIQGELANALVAPNNGRLVAQPPRLSPRQLEILSLMTHGLRNKQIAHRLGISETTVKTHLRVIYAQLGVTSRTEAAAEALRRGLVS